MLNVITLALALMGGTPAKQHTTITTTLDGWTVTYHEPGTVRGRMRNVLRFTKSDGFRTPAIIVKHL